MPPHADQRPQRLSKLKMNSELKALSPGSGILEMRGIKCRPLDNITPGQVGTWFKR